MVFYRIKIRSKAANVAEVDIEEVGGVIKTPLCRSLRNKIDLLRGKACLENFDIIAVTETWIDKNSKNFVSEFKIKGCELFHEDRKGSGRWKRRVRMRVGGDCTRMSATRSSSSGCLPPIFFYPHPTPPLPEHS